MDYEMEVEWNMEWLDPTVPSSGVQNYVLNMQCIIWVAQLIAQYFIIGQSKAINETRITMHNIQNDCYRATAITNPLI